MSAGFYKADGEYLTYAPNFVFNENYTLIKEDKDELLHLDVFPIDGWYWFDTKEQAVEALGADFYVEPDPRLSAPKRKGIVEP